MPFDGQSGFMQPVSQPIYHHRLPNLGQLAHLLRHPERWPSDFQWDYKYHDTCAIGLCNRLYGCGSISIIANGYYVVGTRLWRILNLMRFSSRAPPMRMCSPA